VNDRGSLRAAEFEVGRVVAERYEILAVIGSGTSGTVYRARDLHVDTRHEIVALKAVHPHLHSDRQIFGRFRREVKILKKLEGPHLCRLLDTIEDDGLLMIAIEHVDGPSLEDYLLDHGPLPDHEALAIMRQVCEALQAAHDRDVIHRDLKPSNLLIEGAGARGAVDDDGAPLSFLRELTVRVVDFGLAKMIQGDTAGTVLTEQDMIFGTPDYMAPEQVSGEDLDGRCDVYAAGCILYEMIVGKVPFDTPGPLTTMAAHLNQPVPSPSSEAPDRSVPFDLERVIVSCLAKDPDARIGSAAKLASELERVGQAESQAPDSEIEVELEEGDTGLEHAKTAISSTLASHKDAAVEELSNPRSSVKVIVREAAPATDPPPRPKSTPLRASSEVERRLWVWIAVVAGLAALAVGVWLGVR
jgi:serine/threonine protein kinase